jgi:hypothetical protein
MNLLLTYKLAREGDVTEARNVVGHGGYLLPWVQPAPDHQRGFALKNSTRSLMAMQRFGPTPPPRSSTIRCVNLFCSARIASLAAKVARF